MYYSLQQLQRFIDNIIEASDDVLCAVNYDERRLTEEQKEYIKDCENDINDLYTDLNNNYVYYYIVATDTENNYVSYLRTRYYGPATCEKPYGFETYEEAEKCLHEYIDRVNEYNSKYLNNQITRYTYKIKLHIAKI